MPTEATITSIDTGTDVITATAHGFATGDVVGWFPASTATMPTTTPAINLNVPYIVRRINADTLTLHPTLADANADTNAIAFDDAGEGSLMLVQLSVRERVERQLLATLGAVSGLGEVQRFNMNGNRQQPNTDGTWSPFCIMLTEDEAINDEPSGFYSRVLTVTIESHITVDPTESIATSAVVNRWHAKLEEAVNADPYITETATGRGLVTDLALTGVADFEVQDGQRELVGMLEFEIKYRNLRDDPAVIG